MKHLSGCWFLRKDSAPLILLVSVFDGTKLTHVNIFEEFKFSNFGWLYLAFGFK